MFLGVHWNQPVLFLCAVTSFNTLPNDKILDQSKLKDFVEDKVNKTQKLNIILGRVGGIMGKGENADH